MELSAILMKLSAWPLLLIYKNKKLIFLSPSIPKTGFFCEKNRNKHCTKRHKPLPSKKKNKDIKMNIYFIRRLLPFYAVDVLLETFFTAYEIYSCPFPLDYSFEAVTKSLGITIMTTTASFLILTIPYVIYILLLPFRYQNTKADKWITTIIFGLFCCFPQNIASGEFGRALYGLLRVCDLMEQRTAQGSGLSRCQFQCYLFHALALLPAMPSRTCA